MKNSTYLKNTLLSLIKKLADEHREFLVNPEIDFTRSRKFNMESVIKFIVCMEAGSIKDELYKYFGLNTDNPTASAFVQQRQKIKVEAFKWLFEKFNQLTYDSSDKSKYKGYRLLAIDGSCLPIRYDINDIETYTYNHATHQNIKGFNAFHLTASYDLLEHTYDDLVIQGEAKKDEFEAFNMMVDRYKDHQAIFIADRGFESYNLFTHVIKSNNKFLIRIKDINSINSIAKGLNLGLEGEFDVDIHRILTTKQTKEVKNNPQLYRFMSAKSKFDYIDKDNPYYDFNCRIVRFTISDDTYECIATNLDRDEFPIEVIKEMYHLRWGIETSFRELKYAVGMSAFHAKNKESIKQEIYARMLFYNFSERIMRKVKPKEFKKKLMYIYQINFTRAFHNINTFLKIKDGIAPPDIESIIAKEIEPVRPGRSDPRKIRRQHAVYFIYRFI